MGEVKAIVKVGKTSDIHLSNCELYRAVTIDEMEITISKNPDIHLVVIERISESEQQQLKQFIENFMSIGDNHVLFYINDKDEAVTSGIADELEYEILMTEEALQLEITRLTGVDVSTRIIWVENNEEEVGEAEEEEHEKVEAETEAIEREEIAEAVEAHTEGVAEHFGSNDTTTEVKVEVDNEEIERYKEEIDRLGTDNDKLKKTIDGLTGKLEELKSEVKDKESKNEGLLENISKLEEQIENNSNGSAELHKSIKALEEQVEVNSKKNEELQKQVEAKDKKNEELQKSIKELEEDIKARNEALANGDSEYKEELERLTSTVEKANSKASSLEEENNGLKEEIKKIGLLEEENSRLREDKDGAVAEIGNKDEEISKLSDELEKAKEKYEELTEDFNNTLDKLRESESKFKESESKLKESSGLNDESAERLSECKTKLAEAEKSLAKTRDKLSTTEAKLLEAEKKFTETEIKRVELEKKLETVSRKLASAESKVEETENKYRNVKEESERLAEENDKAVIEKSKLSIEIKELNNSIEEQKLLSEKELKERDNVISEKDRRISELNNNVASLSDKIKELSDNKELTKLRVDLEEIKVEKKSAEMRAETLKEQYDNLMEQIGGDIGIIQTIRGDNEALINVNKGLKDKVAELEGRCTLLQSDNKKLNKSVSTLKESQEQLRNTLDISSKVGGNGADVEVPSMVYSRSGKIINIFGHGSYGITTTVMSTAVRLGQSNKVVILDLDLSAPSLDKWTGKSPYSKEYVGLDLQLRTGVGVLIKHGFKSFMSAAGMINSLKSNKAGSVDYITGLYARLSSNEIASAEYSELLNYLGDKYDYIIVDSGKVGESILHDSLIKSICNIAHKNVYVVNGTSVLHVNSAVIKLHNSEVDTSRVMVMLNMCTNSGISETVKKLLDGMTYDVMHADTKLVFNSRPYFTENSITREKFEVIIKDIIQ